MIFIIGYGSEGVFSYAREKLTATDRVQVLDVESIMHDRTAEIIYDGNGISIKGETTFKIQNGTPIYHRLFLRSEEDQLAQRICNELYNALVSFTIDREDGALVINNPLSSSTNSSKLAQQNYLRTFGFTTPETIVSNQITELINFSELHSELINKGASGFRTIASRVTPAELSRASRLQPWPVMLQEYINGYDVRLHCVGLKPIGLKIETEYPDYRYAQRNGHSISVSELEIPPGIMENCWEYMRAEEQEFAAFDFRVHNDKWVLLEVNSMPGFSFFDKFCNGKISTALSKLLSQGYSNLYRPSTLKSFIPSSRRPDIDRGAVGPRSTL